MHKQTPNIHIIFLFLPSKHNGGTFQYSITMLRALVNHPNLTIDIYYSHDDFLDYFNQTDFLLIKKITHSKLTKVLNVLFPVAEDFNADFIVSPIYDPILLKYKYKYVFTLHDLQEKYFPQNFTVLQRLWRNFAYQKLTRYSKAIICESDFVKTDIEKYYSRQSMIEVIQAPQMLNPDAPVGESVIDQYEDRKYFFYPAYFKPHKNHSRLIQAFALFSEKHKDFYLLLTGSKSNEYKNLVNLISDLNLCDKVIFVGRLDDGALIKAYKKAFAMIMPSLFESISIPVLEAYMLGVPVCASSIDGVREQVSGQGFLFNPLDYKDISNIMLEMVENEEKREAYKTKALIHSERINDIGRYGANLYNLLKKLKDNVN